jgi:Ser/Thr protein kinase RdoA (MazF antagonist)
MKVFPVTRSILSTSALAEYLTASYDIGRVKRCVLYSPGVNDTYEIITERGDRFFLRVYRTPWRSYGDVAYEIDALNHLRRKGFPAAYPVVGFSGLDIARIQAPEGERCVVLFTLAPGKEANYDVDGEPKARQYGQAMADLHNALDDFESEHQRPHLDVDTLIFSPLRLVEPYLKHRPQDWDYLTDFIERLVKRIQTLPMDELEWGFCHGDLQGHHHHISDHGTLTFFDFDCCGYGIRAYDLAVFHWCFHQEDNQDVMWAAYRQGYQEVRPLTEVNLAAIPLFICARYTWHMGLHTGNAADWGRDWLDDGYFDRALKKLHDCERDFLR